MTQDKKGALGNPRLMAYLAGSLFSVFGTWGQRVIVFWMAWDLTGSTAVLGTLSMLELLPSVVAAPLAGAMADRRSGFEVARNVQALSALPPLMLAAAMVFDQVHLPILMMLTLLTGILNGFDHPLRLLLVGSVVPREQVSRAITANSIVFNVGRMVGPALGGWAISSGAQALLFGYNALSFLIFAIIIATLTPPKSPDRTARAPGIGVMGDWRTIPSLIDRPVQVIFLLFAGIAILIRPIFELLPSFADGLRLNGIDAAQLFSVLTSAQGLGAMLGALVASVLLSRLPYQSFAMGAGLASTLAALAFLASPEAVVAIVALAVLAAAILANGIATQVTIQTRVPEAIRGRALSLYTMTFRGMPALGALFVGTFGELMPLRLLAAALAVAMFLLSACVWWAARRF